MSSFLIDLWSLFCEYWALGFFGYDILPVDLITSLHRDNLTSFYVEVILANVIYVLSVVIVFVIFVPFFFIAILPFGFRLCLACYWIH